MGLATITAIATGIANEVTEVRGLDPGILHVASVRCLDTGLAKGDCLARVALHRGGSDDAMAGGNLLQDYVYDNHHPTWTGFIYLESADEIKITVQGLAGLRVRLNCLVTKLQQSTLGGLLVDQRPGQ